MRKPKSDIKKNVLNKEQRLLSSTETRSYWSVVNKRIYDDVT